MSNNDIKTTPANRDTRPMPSPGGNARRRPSGATSVDDSALASVTPETSGASAKNAGLSKSRVAHRNSEDKREAGVAPPPAGERGGL
jgi:hypothetical protein